MKKKKKNTKNNIYIYLVIIIILIVLIIIYSINNMFLNKSVNNILLDKSKDLVYTYYEDKENDKEIPIINIKKVNNEVNNSINSFVEPYIEKKYNKIYYEYNISGNILSLILTIEDYEVEGLTDVHFLSYVIDLKKLKILNNQEILDMFNKNEEEIIYTLENNFKTIYEEEKSNNIISSNISFDDYLISHDVVNYTEQMYYGVKDSKLIVYLDYTLWSPIEPVPYLENIGYAFEVE